jgi:serine/threonine protein phosphatase 1
MTPIAAPGLLPVGQRVYAVGDVHGCLDQLADMHRRIAADLAARPVAEPLVLHLGDYIDRGPDSAGVIAALLAPFPATPRPRVVNLIGNHEDLLLQALSGRRVEAEVWLANGGHAALQSWGVPPRTPPKKWSSLIPAAHIAFMRDLALVHRAGDYVFVHAGLRPGLRIDQQTRQDLLWIREPFLSSSVTHEAIVVHGHTPEDSQPVLRANRLGLDTGAVLGGPLTCAVLERDSVFFLQT